MLDRESPRRIEDAIAQLRLQPALIDVEHAIEASRNMKSKSDVTLELLTARDLFLGQPSLVAEREFHLVAVPVLFGITDRVADIDELEAADALEGIGDVLALPAKLFAVREVL